MWDGVKTIVGYSRCSVGYVAWRKSQATGEKVFGVVTAAHCPNTGWIGDSWFDEQIPLRITSGAQGGKSEQWEPVLDEKNEQVERTVPEGKARVVKTKVHTDVQWMRISGPTTTYPRFRYAASRDQQDCFLPDRPEEDPVCSFNDGRWGTFTQTLGPPGEPLLKASVCTFGSSAWLGGLGGTRRFRCGSVTSLTGTKVMGGTEKDPATGVLLFREYWLENAITVYRANASTTTGGDSGSAVWLSTEDPGNNGQFDWDHAQLVGIVNGASGIGVVPNLDHIANIAAYDPAKLYYESTITPVYSANKVLKVKTATAAHRVGRGGVSR
jgi:hypothetical protein